MATSSSSSSRYRTRILARQMSAADSQESKEPEPEPDQSSETSSLSAGSSESYYLMVDYNNEEPVTTPPPIAGPPSDASYDDSFIEMVKQTVQRARMAYAISQTPKRNDDSEEDSIFNYFNSQSSILLSSQGSNQSNNGDDEARVEQARRPMDPHHNDIPLPYYLKEDSSEKLIDSQASLPEFAVIKKNPSTVNDIEYATNKKPEKEQKEKEAKAAVESRLYFKKECDLYNDAIKELTCWQQEEEEEEIGSSTDYSSWLCFDNENEVAQFKDIMYNENSDSKHKTTTGEEALSNAINNDGDNDYDDNHATSPLFSSLYSISQPCSPQLSPSRHYSCSPQQRPPSHNDPSPSYQIEQNQVIVISPHREQLKQKQNRSIHDRYSSPLGNFKDMIVMQSTPVHQRQSEHRLCADNTQPIRQNSNSNSENTSISEKKRNEDEDLLFGSNQEVEERRAALFDRVKKQQPNPPRQPFFNLRK